MINKKIALEILSEIKKAKNILFALHISPDEDCLGSVLAMEAILRKMGKKTKIISKSQINNFYSFFYKFSSFDKIEIFDFSEVDLTKFDLFIALDCAQERMITRNQYPKIPKTMKVINIDHHATNTNFGDINLIQEVSSASEIIYQLFKVWKVEISKQVAELLLAGIVADSGCFQYKIVDSLTLATGSQLMKKGASLNDIVLSVFRSHSLKTLKYWGKILDNLQINEDKKFVWSSISQIEKDELGIMPSDIEDAASLFAPIVKDTEFGIILIEESPDLIRGSIRARDNFDVSKIAMKLGGGGHKSASGFSLSMSLGEAERKVLETARTSVE